MARGVLLVNVDRMVKRWLKIDRHDNGEDHDRRVAHVGSCKKLRVRERSIRVAVNGKHIFSWKFEERQKHGSPRTKNQGDMKEEWRLNIPPVVFSDAVAVEQIKLRLGQLAWRRALDRAGLKDGVNFRPAPSWRRRIGRSFKAVLPWLNLRAKAGTQPVNVQSWSACLLWTH